MNSDNTGGWLIAVRSEDADTPGEPFIVYVAAFEKRGDALDTVKAANGSRMTTLKVLARITPERVTDLGVAPGYASPL